ncbi:hypothetical protein EYF80_056249 [Liparis tanakae]|uniref:Uncharacterized protein n=1 Tax=Liparis tanakae TaxID=230148 RepID=A0A4Z2EXX3_9TELE|nr:hypothetical protein EYF80_056249 [Liparis tanakae]
MKGRASCPRLPRRPHRPHTLIGQTPPAVD